MRISRPSRTNAVLIPLLTGLLIFQMVFPPTLQACLWDTETIADERQRIPGTLELIVGKFPRHSKAFYQWRLDDRLRKLESDPENDALLDDIAVSYEKLGRYEEAIETARRQLMRDPKRYESLANLGTFLIHAGRYEEGAEQIQAAIDVNPDAHFGREKIQLALVQFLIEEEMVGEGKAPLIEQLPMESHRISPETNPHSGISRFASFLAKQFTDGERKYLKRPEVDEAIRGVTGMMRFSRYDSPVLLDILGQLLEIDEANRMAARCYLMAAHKLEVDHPEKADAYRALARTAMKKQHIDRSSMKTAPFAPLAKRLEKEIAEGESWFNELVANEQKWIEAGDDVEARFEETYRYEPELAGLVTTPKLGSYFPTNRPFLLPLAIVTALLAIGSALFLYRRVANRAA